MNLHRVSAALFLLSALLFLYVGLARTPRDTTYVVLGALFLVFAIVRFRGGRRP